MEPFGGSERNWTEEEKEEIISFLKTDHHVSLKIVEMVQSAETYVSRVFSRNGVAEE
jgi:hypothetical protein